MKLYLDFETRSTVDLKKCGAYRYAEDPTTDIFCMAFKLEGIDEDVHLWMPEWDRELFSEYVDDGMFLDRCLKQATSFHAHNAQFERAMWRHVMGRYGFADIPREQWYCTAAKAAAMGLPRSLDQASRALGLGDTKDADGRRVMLKMCKPRKPLVKERKANPDWERTLYWHENPDEFAILAGYCKQDVRVEEAIDLAIPDLVHSEREVWLLDQKINDRGLHLDLESIEAITNTLDLHETALSEETLRLTDWQINSMRQRKALDYMRINCGHHIDGLDKVTVINHLERDNLPPKVRRLLEIRQQVAMSSVKKLQSMAATACSDHRTRGTLLYWGATRTGRWAGRLIQPQNLPRGDLELESVEAALAIFRDGWGDIFESPSAVASSCVRGLITSAPHHDLRAADFANIEGRCAAWLAGEEWKLEAFRAYDEGTGPDLYKLAYSRAFGIPVEDITKDQRFIGKVMELSLQYQGWVGAFSTMAFNYGVTLPEEEVVNLCGKWRQAHPCIVHLWRALENGMLETVRTGEQRQVGRIRFGIRGDFLHMRLPSGRLLSYHKPGIVQRKDRYDRLKDSITYMGLNSTTYQWTRLHTYGGKIFENAIQALARDVMVEAMFRVEEANYPLVLTVHDEIVAETPQNGGHGQEEFEGLMSIVPAWAPGLPVAVAGWNGHRYRKD